jgi:hypothetical protein
MDNYSKECLISYVNNLDLSSEVSISIKRSIINYGKTHPITLYRGQQTNKLNSTHWFSTSSSMNVAKYDFAGQNGFTFIIHIDDAMFLDVNSYLTTDDVGSNLDENEYIVQCGGKFYTDSTFQREGHVHLSSNLIETWYHIGSVEVQNINTNIIVNVNECTIEQFHELNFDELEFITNKEELYNVFAELKYRSVNYVDQLYEYLLLKTEK